jgi:hypothetical protein
MRPGLAVVGFILLMVAVVRGEPTDDLLDQIPGYAAEYTGRGFAGYLKT